MKKILLSTVALCMAAVTTASAQEFSYGAKLGLNISNISMSYDNSDYDEGDDEGDKSRMSFVLGVMGEYKLSDQMAVSAELLYSAQGDKSKSEDSDDDYSSSYTYKTNLSYINIPILFNYYVAEGIAVKAGIQPGFLLGAKYKYSWEKTQDGETESGDDDEDAKKDYNSIDFSIPIGVSYNITENIMVDARYNIGVANISKYTEGGYSEKNNVFQLSVGYKF